MFRLVGVVVVLAAPVLIVVAALYLLVNYDNVSPLAVVAALIGAAWVIMRIVED